MILEGMKMEHRIEAPYSGSIEEIYVCEGDQVSNDEMLVVISKLTESGN